MASRKNVPRLALLAALAALLSGCYAHGGGRYTTYFGGGYAYGGPYHAPPSHAYHKHRHHKPGLQRQEPHPRSAARERDPRPERTRHLERRRDPGAEAPRRDVRVSADRKAEPRPAPADPVGRRDEWLPGPTARDEGPHPGAEGGAR